MHFWRNKIKLQIKFPCGGMEPLPCLSPVILGNASKLEYYISFKYSGSFASDIILTTSFSVSLEKNDLHLHFPSFVIAWLLFDSQF